MMTCTICNDAGWMCETHENEAFPCQFCEHGGTAMPCICNEDELRPPAGFVSLIYPKGH